MNWNTTRLIIHTLYIHYYIVKYLETWMFRTFRSFFWDFFQSKRCLFYVHLSSHSPRSLECWQKGFSVTRYMYLNVSCQWTDNSLSYYKTVSTTPRLSKLLRFSVNTFAFCLNCIVYHRHQEAVVLKLEDKESTTMPFPMKTAKHVSYSTGK